MAGIERERRAAVVLNVLFHAGSLYFLCIAAAHAAGIKVPGLFIYFSVPSYEYQDRIIAALAFGWSAFFHAAGRNPTGALPVAALVAGFVAVATLVTINLTADFRSLSQDVEPFRFHIEAAMLALYWICLLAAYLMTGKDRSYELREET